MQYVPYPERTKAWASEGWTRQLTAVLMLDSQQPIKTMRDYLNLLELRVAWMIDERIKEVEAERAQTEEDEMEMTPVEQVRQEIWAIAKYPEVPNLGSLNLNSDSMGWAFVMIQSHPDFLEALESLGTRENLFPFPLIPLEPEESKWVQELIQETTLEEWLTLMRAAMATPERD